MKPIHDGAHAPYPWECAEPIFSGDLFFERFGEMCRAAQHSIDIDFYIFEDDVIGRQIFAELAAAKQRGVKVRIIVDGFGSVWWPSYFGVDAQKSGVEYRVYHHLWFESFLMNRPRIQEKIRGFLSWIQILNRRNHRKIAIFDRTISLVGSRNISAVHAESVMGSYTWRDSSIQLHGPGVSILAEHFDYVWNSHRLLRRFKRNGSLPGPPNGSIRHNLTRSARKRNLTRLLSDINGAKCRIWITNAYFVPQNKLLTALKRAAKRGCDVQIILPAISDVFFIPWVTSTLQQELIESGVQIFEYLPSILHAKSIIIDDWVMLGSSNLNHRSFLHDLETDVVVFVPNTTALFSNQFEIDRSRSREVGIQSFQPIKAWSRTMGKLLWPLRRWM
jgi:cardiolipin synthase